MHEPVFLPDTHRHRLRCARIGETFQIDVALPSLRAAPTAPLPVVYVLDANTVFGIAAQAIRFLQDRDGVPPVLLVGIGYCLDEVERPRSAFGALRTRDFTPSLDQGFLDRLIAAQQGRPFPVDVRPAGGADDFLAFLVDELRPFIAERYSVDAADQTLVGSSLGGLFSLYALLSRPGAFRRHVANSPALWWDERMIFGQLAEAAELTGDVFISAGEGEPSTVEDIHRFTDALREHPGLTITTHIFEGETHTSVIPAALSRGLRTVLSGEREAPK